MHTSAKCAHAQGECSNTKRKQMQAKVYVAGQLSLKHSFRDSLEPH